MQTGTDANGQRQIYFQTRSSLTRPDHLIWGHLTSPASAVSSFWTAPRSD
jgi:hypothetical protein